MLYFVYSEGFRLGGANSPRAVQAGVGIPAEYGPDTIKNYELGLKSLWLDKRLQLNIDVFLMHWDDIQLYARTDGGSWWVRGIFNGKTAEQKGIERGWCTAPTTHICASANWRRPPMPRWA
jgi:iron complex outermembrane recepter protein